MKHPVTISICLEVIADLISGQQIAERGPYELIWLSDHFVVRKIALLNSPGEHILKLSCQDINKGLKSCQWDKILKRLQYLLESEVIK